MQKKKFLHVAFTFRYNANNQDLNRNFPDFFIENTATTQQESEHLIDWLSENQFVLSATLHGGAVVANYPYDNNGKRKVYLP